MHLTTALALPPYRVFIGWSGTLPQPRVGHNINLFCKSIGDFGRLARHLAAACCSVRWLGTLPQYWTASDSNRRLWYLGCNLGLGNSGKLVRHLAAAYPCGSWFGTLPQLLQGRQTSK
jgi:hypothetical protein